MVVLLVFDRKIASIVSAQLNFQFHVEINISVCPKLERGFAPCNEELRNICGSSMYKQGNKEHYYIFLISFM